MAHFNSEPVILPQIWCALWKNIGPLLWKLRVCCSSKEEPLVSCPTQLLVCSRLESLPPLAGIKGELCLFIHMNVLILMMWQLLGLLIFLSKCKIDCANKECKLSLVIS